MNISRGLLSVSATISATVTATAIVMLGASPAFADSDTLSDPAGEVAPRFLDITEASVNNGERSIQASITFAEDRRGTVIVGVETRFHGVWRIVSKHRDTGPDRTFLVNEEGRVACDGLTGKWDRANATVAFTLPSRCINNGNFGAIKPWLLTEPLNSGSDGDLTGFESWIARG